jgi:hypothetical protein
MQRSIISRRTHLNDIFFKTHRHIGHIERFENQSVITMCPMCLCVKKNVVYLS